jgi:penicillin-binding protein 1A
MDDLLEPWRAHEPAPTSRWRFRVALALVLGIVALEFSWLVWALPLDQALEPLPQPTLVLLDRHGEAFARRGETKLEPVDAKRLPRHLVDAVVAIEDRRFYHHHGLDPRGLVRAAWHNARAGGIVEGGSTITQQLAKTSFLTPARTVQRKAQEALIALWLEARLDKEEILSRYLSGIYFGDGMYGLRAASRHYFDVEPEQLDLAQSAMLAGMIKAPSALAPSRHPREAAARMRVVLEAMAEQGKIDAAQARDADAPQVRVEGDALPVGSYFADWVSPQAREELEGGYGELRVDTTLDLRLQRLAEQAFARNLDGERPQAALVAMRPDGEVVAMLGGRDYHASAFNRATQARRQPGSAFKPFVYYAAMRQGLAPDDLVDDAPVEVAGWTPANYDGRYLGPVTVREAFARSSNVAAVRVAQRVGPAEVARTAREFGIDSKLGDDASIALGSYETTLLELVSGYAGFASGATPVRAYGLREVPPRDARQPLDPRARAKMLDLLESAVDEGTGRAAKLGIPTFGKTGTTQDHRDALFVGMAGDLVAGVWVGNDDNAPMDGVTGGSVPARIWHDFMAGAAKGDSFPGPVRELGEPPPAPARQFVDIPVHRVEWRPPARVEPRFFPNFARGHGHGRGHGHHGGGHRRH